MKLDNLPNLGEELKKIEEKEDIQLHVGLVDARLALLNAMEQYRASRYRLGRMLSAYRQFYTEARAWMSVANAIAGVLGCDERTVRRIVSDYESVAQVPDAVIKALENAGIDPAARRNASVIGRILKMPSGAFLANPDSTLRSVVDEEARARSRHSDQGARTSANIRQVRQRLTIRKKVRSALKSVPIERKLQELLAAVEEEMFSEWGLTEPVTLMITPRKSEADEAFAQGDRMVA